MIASRQEVNFRRLLAKCELLSKQNDNSLLAKYVETLQEMLRELRQKSEVSHEKLLNYQQRIISVQTVAGLPMEPQYALDDMSLPSSERHQRQQLFDVDGSGDEPFGSALRHRSLGPSKRTGSDGDIDHVLNYHESMQQRITGEILEITASLKEQSQLANRIIRNDVDVVGRTTQHTDRNYTKLTVESAKLGLHTRNACKCWLWLMLAVVIVIFINMVLFMKVMKKS